MKAYFCQWGNLLSSNGFSFVSISSQIVWAMYETCYCSQSDMPLRFRASTHLQTIYFDSNQIHATEVECFFFVQQCFTKYAPAAGSTNISSSSFPSRYWQGSTLLDLLGLQLKATS